jgi:hypothetical protein
MHGPCQFVPRTAARGEEACFSAATTPPNFFTPGSSAVTGLTDVVALKGEPTNKNGFSPAKNACFTGLVTGSRTW